MRYIAIFFFFTINVLGFNYHLKSYTIVDGVDCFFGLPSQVSYVNGGNMINSCYIETNEGYIVIDSGPTYTYAQEAYRIMQTKKKLPVKYVINTSSDEVHVLGNEFYKEQGAELLGPGHYKQYVEGKESLVLNNILTKDAMINTHMIALDNYIDEDSTILLGKTSINIKIEEGDDRYLYVYIKNKKILFAGDMLFNNRMVPLKYNRSLILWQKSLDKLSKLDWKHIVSSHGYKTKRSAIVYTKNYLSQLKQGILDGIKNNKTKKEMLENFSLSDFKEDRQYAYWHPLNVASAYSELKALLAQSDKGLKESTFIVKKLLTAEENNLVSDKKIERIKLSKSTINNKPKVFVSPVKYVSFTQAINRANRKKKIVLIKVRSTICKYCDQLDRVIKKNNKLKKLLNKYFEVVKINSDYNEIPLGLTIRSTPTLIFIRPNNQKVLMKLHGIQALGELLEILNEAIDDGHNGGYLKK